MNHITEAHRRKAFAMMGEIADHAGYETKSKFYSDIIKPMYNKATDGDFSLSEKVCTVDEFDLFMEFLLELAFSLDVQFKVNPREYIEDTEKYLIICLKNRKCCITGLPDADRHHTLTVGMGNDRNDMNHSLMPRIALCREKHAECHAMGQEAFNKKYHVFGVYADCKDDNAVDEPEHTAIEIYQNIKKMQYNAEKKLFGVRFNNWVPGCNESNLIYYRMAEKEYYYHKNSIDPYKHFTEEIYGKFEIVEM